ncbi:MAG: hypothetical protein JEZ04_15670 [Spirochaetales bacterium]|nr:hypothetical protein [Spirochaetales bacterium]
MRLFTAESVVEITKERKPDFIQIEQVLSCKRPDRPTLFEFYANDRVEQEILTAAGVHSIDPLERKLLFFRYAGYDYANINASDFTFHSNIRAKGESASYNSQGVITDRRSFEIYQWPDPEKYPLTALERSKELLPDGMKLMVCGPNGLLENVIDLCGYETLCYMLYDDRGLVKDIFDAVGARLLVYYQMAADYEHVGILMDNDDWGFNTQTMLSTNDMQEFVFPWHRKIIEAAHVNNKKAVLHSCGQAASIYEYIISDLKLDGKHSFEDTIEPVETAYEHLKGRIAVLGGIDVDFMSRKLPGEIYARARKILNLTKQGGYALGTGNSIPEYVPDENYYALLHAALDYSSIY